VGEADVAEYIQRATGVEVAPRLAEPPLEQLDNFWP